MQALIFDFLIEFMMFGESGIHAFTVVNCRDLCIKGDSKKTSDSFL